MSLVGRQPIQSLSGRVIRSGLWLVALSLTGRLITVVRLVILARLLTPHDFGLVGIALLVISLFESFSVTGVDLALIQRKERARELFDTAWTLGLIRGGIMAGLIIILAPVVGMFFKSPQAMAVMQVMALVPLIGGLTNSGVVEFRKELTFGPYYLLNISGVVADLCVAVPLALWLRSAWALVGGWLALSAARVVMSYVLHPYRPTLRLDLREVGVLLGYGRWIFGSSAIGWLLSDGVHVVVGRLLGVQALGFYQMGWRVASVATKEVAELTSVVTVGAYAELQEARERVRLGYLRVLTAVALAVAPIAVVVGIYGEDLVRVLLGSHWSSIVPIVQILALFGLVRAIGATAGPVFQGLGRPRVQTLLACGELGLLAGLLGPLTLWLGLVGTALAATFEAVGGAAGLLWAVCRLLGIQARELVPILGWPLLACLPFAALRVRVLGPLDTLVGLAGAIFMSGILYLTVLVLLDRLNLYNLRPVMPSGIRQSLS